MSGAPTAAASQNPPKSKRTRTGCLTCRKRHLKCDEAQPVCQNCVKSKKFCERGIRLNFLETNCEDGDHFLPRGRDWRITFIDESRDIAAEYKGGSALYSALPTGNIPPPSQNTQQPHLRRQSQIDPQLHQFAGAQYMPQTHLPQPQPIYIPPGQLPPAPPAPSMPYAQLPAAHEIQQAHENQAYMNMDNSRRHPETYRSRDPYAHSAPVSAVEPPMYSPHTQVPQSAGPAPPSHEYSDLDEKREQLKDANEVLYMQVFCEEVGIWMDSMDPMKHFSRLLPFHSLAEPMLRNAFLACGARHLQLVNPIYTEERALLYYDTATRHLLKNLQDPDRDTVVCATTAVILNVYEIMCERALPRMNHIAGARALIKECGWDARAVGVGAACFWLNVGLEVLSCLHFKWQAAWDPDDWGMDMDWTREVHNGREEIWTHRMLYIVAKVSNFRATVPKKELPDPNEERARKQARYKEWQTLNEFTDSWNNRIPRTMHPMAYIFPEQTLSKSAFPEVWLIKRTTIVARLFYHTVMVLLAQTNPLKSRSDPEMWEMERTHAHMICGIAAHVKDRGVASVALRSLAHAAECLTERHEQQEVLDIFTKINRETGWRIAFVFKELKALWGWKDDPNVPSPHITSNSDPTPRPVVAEHKPHSLNFPPPSTNNESMSPHSTHSSSMSASHHNGHSQQGFVPPMTNPTSSVSPVTPGRPKMPSGIKNPLFANADFSMPQHPYQNVWVAPNVLPPPPQLPQAEQYPRSYHAGSGLYY